MKSTFGNPNFTTYVQVSEKMTLQIPNRKVVTAQPVPKLGLLKEEDFQTWYQHVLIKGEMIESHDTSGSFILKVSTFFIAYNLNRQA
jgi:hypothetical protein